MEKYEYMTVIVVMVVKVMAAVMVDDSDSANYCDSEAVFWK